MATRLEKMTPKQYEWAFMKLVERGAPDKYKLALTRDFGRATPRSIVPLGGLTGRVR